MKKIALLLATLALAGAMAGCGGSKQAAAPAPAAQPAAPAAEAVHLVVGATAKPHAEILEVVKPMLAEEGIDL